MWGVDKELLLVFVRKMQAEVGGLHENMFTVQSSEISYQSISTTTTKTTKKNNNKTNKQKKNNNKKHCWSLKCSQSYCLLDSRHLHFILEPRDVDSPALHALSQ